MSRSRTCVFASLKYVSTSEFSNDDQNLVLAIVIQIVLLCDSNASAAQVTAVRRDTRVELRIENLILWNAPRYPVEGPRPQTSSATAQVAACLPASAAGRIAASIGTWIVRTLRITCGSMAREIDPMASWVLM